MFCLVRTFAWAVLPIFGGVALAEIPARPRANGPTRLTRPDRRPQNLVPPVRSKRRLLVGLGSSYFAADTADRLNGTTGVLLSNLNLGLFARWYAVALERYEVFVHVTAVRNTFQNAPGISLDTNNLSLFAAEGGPRFRPFAAPVYFEFGIGLRQLFVLRAIDDLGNFALDVVTPPGISAGILGYLVTQPSFRLGLQAGGQVLFPATTGGFTLRTSYRYFIGLETRFKLQPGELRLGLEFEREHTNTTISEQIRRQIGLTVGLEFDI